MAEIARAAGAEIGLRRALQRTTPRSIVAVMAESFGNSFSIVEVTPDDASSREPATEIWIALAKPSQAR